MSALERVARRIGMHLEEHRTSNSRRARTEEQPEYWWDGGQPICLRQNSPALRAYLLTGDRPLRVQMEYEIQTLPSSYASSCGEPWYSIALDKPGAMNRGASGPTPAAAIIALAERIEGEGRE